MWRVFINLAILYDTDASKHIAIYQYPMMLYNNEH